MNVAVKIHHHLSFENDLTLPEIWGKAPNDFSNDLFLSGNLSEASTSLELIYNT